METAGIENMVILAFEYSCPRINKYVTLETAPFLIYSARSYKNPCLIFHSQCFVNNTAAFEIIPVI